MEVLKVMEAFSNEDNYTVWSSINNCLAKLSLLLSHTDLKEDLKRYMRVLMTPIYKKLGWEPKENESKIFVDNYSDLDRDNTSHDSL